MPHAVGVPLKIIIAVRGAWNAMRWSSMLHSPVPDLSDRFADRRCEHLAHVGWARPGRNVSRCSILATN
eukprot:416172-Pyramimonas_sp.AAC.1